MEKGIPLSITRHIAYADGAVVSKTLIDKGIGNITLFSFDRGQGLSEHTSPYDAVVQILDGAARISIGGTDHTVCSGEMIIMPAGIPHALQAEQPFKMMLTMLRAATTSRDEPEGPLAV